VYNISFMYTYNISSIYNLCRDNHLQHTIPFNTQKRNAPFVPLNSRSNLNQTLASNVLYMASYDLFFAVRNKLATVCTPLCFLWFPFIVCAPTWHWIIPSVDGIWRWWCYGEWCDFVRNWWLWLWIVVISEGRLCERGIVGDHKLRILW